MNNSNNNLNKSSKAFEITIKPRNYSSLWRYNAVFEMMQEKYPGHIKIYKINPNEDERGYVAIRMANLDIGTRVFDMIMRYMRFLGPADLEINII